jgi:hypothetical protein
MALNWIYERRGGELSGEQIFQLAWLSLKKSAANKIQKNLRNQKEGYT